MEAVILAGGQGTRLRPLTDTLPKPLLPFMGEPYAAGLLRRLAVLDATRATFLVGQDVGPWRPLGELGAQFGIDVGIATEEVPLGTAGAARRLLNRGVDGAVLVCNGDILTDLDFAALLTAHGRTGAVASIALTRVPDTSAFGVVVCNANGRVERFVEKPPPGTLPANTINAGTYVLEPDVFSSFPGDSPLSFEREVFPGLVASGATVLGYPSDAHWADLGTPERYLAGHRAVLEGSCRWPAAPEMERRDSVAVHRSAQVADDAKLGPYVVIGPGCAVGDRARVRDTVLHEGVRIGAGAIVEGAILGPRSVVAARVRLRPGRVLGEGVVCEA
jgi:mannose-1-phosphate guanylyltransferase